MRQVMRWVVSLVVRQMAGRRLAVARRLAALAASTVGRTAGCLVGRTAGRTVGRTVGRGKPWSSRSFVGALGSKGQATVEYLIVSLALLAIILALGTFAGRVQEGLFVEHALNSPSHAVGGNTMGVIGDVLLY